MLQSTIIMANTAGQPADPKNGSSGQLPNGTVVAEEPTEAQLPFDDSKVTQYVTAAATGGDSLPPGSVALPVVVSVSAMSAEQRVCKFREISEPFQDTEKPRLDKIYSLSFSQNASLLAAASGTL